MLKPQKVLVIESNPEYMDFLQTSLQQAEAGKFDIIQAGSMSKALSFLRLHSLKQEVFDIILLDLFLPDSQGLDSFLQIYAQAPEIPIVTLTDLENKTLALDVIREGAQDCIYIEEMDEVQITRSVLFAIERHRTWAMLQHLCLTDDLTGLLNRRGFLSLAQHQVKLARREDWQLLILFADLDGLKKINDNFGHPQGDVALRTVADILRDTFRSSDLIARLGGDEFIVMATNVSPDGVKTIAERLQETIKRYNEELPGYQLSLSWGVSHFNTRLQYSLDEVILQADQALYHQKHQKQKNLA